MYPINKILIKHIKEKKRKETENKMIYGGIYYNYIIITGFDKNDTHFQRKGKFVSKHANRVSTKNMNHSFRRRGGIKQPGGASCNQRR